MQHLRQVAGLSDAQRLRDAQLLGRYVSSRDQDAFTELVRRYGWLVRSVCRHVLRHESDIDDAFQATFLVFASRAGSIRKSSSVASWLYGVAYRSAMKIKGAAARRHEKQREPGGYAREQPVTEAALREVQALLHEEVQRLAEKHRAPFVLCCLEGKSRAEAARLLGLKEGTISSRMAQARQQLQRRLARRGVLLSAALCAVELSRTTAAASVPPVLLKSAIKGALAFAAGRGQRTSCPPRPPAWPRECYTACPRQPLRPQRSRCWRRLC
jgi:RNA polymerase sigma factor (sigma-70 family)